MRELTEQEIKYRNQKCNELFELSPSNMSMVIGFDTGFIAGVESQQAEIERLRAALAEAEQDAALLSKALKDLASELTKSNAGR